MFSAAAVKSAASLVLPFGLVFWAFYPNQRTSEPANQRSATIEVPLAKLALKAGGMATTDVRIVNGSARSIRIERFKSSCECLTVDIPREGIVVPPRATVVVRATVDLRRDPKNDRSFAPEIEFFGEGIATSILAKVDVEVTAP